LMAAKFSKLRLRHHFLCLVIVFVPLHLCALDIEDQPLLVNGSYLISDTPTPPGPNAAWRPLRLPDSVSTRQIAADRLGWIRLPVSQPAKSQVMAVYLWRYGMNAAVFFNDQFLGDGGAITNALIRNTHRPLLFPVAQTSWREGQNYIYVQLKGVGGYARLMPPAFAPFEQLRPLYDRRVFLQLELPQSLSVVVMLVCLLSFLYWLSNRKNKAYLVLSGACLAWLPFCVNPFIFEVPISMHFWRWLLHSSIDVFGASLCMFAHRFLLLRRVRFEAVLVSYVCLASIIYFLLPDDGFASIAIPLHGLTILLGFYTFTILVKGYRATKQLGALVFAVGIAVFTILGIHDALFSALPFEQTWQNSFLATTLGAPGLFLALAGDLTWRTYRANIRLQEEVSKATAELVINFEEKEKLQKKHVAMEERHRIYRDLHDDVGARLLSLIYIAETKEQEQLARGAFEDIRGLVQANIGESIPLVDLAAQWQSEMRQRCGEFGIEFVWSANELSGLIAPHVSYHLTRILRELASNVFRHANGSRLSLNLSLAEKLIIELWDNGDGFTQSQNNSGRGLSNVKRRVDRLDGEVIWKNSADGCCVSLQIPVAD